MKVLLIKDVYKLGRAGDIKKVADGYGRNYLIPQKLAIPATQGALKLAESIGRKATERRAVLNEELSSVAEVLNGITLNFTVKAGETGKLYGSVTTQMIADEIKANHELELDKRQIVMEPIRKLGEFKIPVHLTIDLVPEVNVFVHREGEAVIETETETSETETSSEVEIAAEEVVEEAVLPADAPAEEISPEVAEEEKEETPAESSEVKIKAEEVVEEAILPAETPTKEITSEVAEEEKEEIPAKSSEVEIEKTIEETTED